MKKSKIIYFIFILFMGMAVVNAKTSAKVIDDVYTNYYGVKIESKSYEKLLKFMNEGQIKYLNQKMYDLIMDDKIQDYDGALIETTYVVDYLGNPRIEMSREVEDIDSESFQSVNSTNAGGSDEVVTDYKYIRLLVSTSNNGTATITLLNEWLKMPKYKSFDVIATRWTGGFYMTSYTGSQQTDGNSGDINYTEGNGNYKIASNGVGLSQNLVDSATNELFNNLYVKGNCSGSGTVYGTYQHAQKNITLATSQLYNFRSGGMGNVLDFYGAAVGVYDDTPGLEVSYTC